MNQEYVIITPEFAKYIENDIENIKEKARAERLEYLRKYQREHKDKMREYQARYRKRHAEAIKAYQKVYRDKRKHLATHIETKQPNI